MKQKWILKSNMALMMVLFVFVVLNANTKKVYAQVTYSEKQDTITLESGYVGENAMNYLEMKVSDINKNDVLTIESDNSNIVGFTYSEEDEKDYIEDADKMELKVGNNTVKNGKWSDYFTIVTRRAGNCNVTVSVNGVLDKTFKIVVKATVPKVSLEAKSMWNVDATNEIKFSGVSKYSEITISSNKTLNCSYTMQKPKIMNIQKNAQTLNFTKLEEEGFYINPKMKKMNAGTYKITVTVKQNDNTYNLVLNLKVKKYVNPFSSIKIGTVSLTKPFNNHRTVSDTHYGKVPVKTAKKTLGGKNLSIKMKKGYKVYKISYRRKDEWGTKKHNLKFTTLKNGTVIPSKPLEKDFWELYIYYKKGNKKVGCNEVYWSYAVFN